eukprot:COSAG06_NODE_2206_length_7346_cov_4.936387_2_plen_369_part_00
MRGNRLQGSLASAHPELVPGLELVRVAGQDVRGCDIETGGYYFKNAARPITLGFVKPTKAAAAAATGGGGKSAAKKKQKRKDGGAGVKKEVPLAAPAGLKLVGSEMAPAELAADGSSTPTSPMAPAQQGQGQSLRATFGGGGGGAGGSGGGGGGALRATAEFVWSCSAEAGRCQLQYGTKGLNKWVTIDLDDSSTSSAALTTPAAVATDASAEGEVEWRHTLQGRLLSKTYVVRVRCARTPPGGGSSTPGGGAGGVKVWSGWSPKLSIGRNTDLTLVRTEHLAHSAQHTTAQYRCSSLRVVLVQRFTTLLRLSTLLRVVWLIYNRAWGRTHTSLPAVPLLPLPAPPQLLLQHQQRRRRRRFRRRWRLR